jgi:hypothetical protein
LTEIRSSCAHPKDTPVRQSENQARYLKMEKLWSMDLYDGQKNRKIYPYLEYHPLARISCPFKEYPNPPDELK